MTPKREIDLEAQRLIDGLIAMEALPWPASLDAYADALLALAIRCEAKPGKGELLRWLRRACGGLLATRSEAWRECLQDGLHEAVVRGAGLLLRCRAALNPTRAPNLRSIFGATILWRARFFHTSRYGRHGLRLADWSVHSDRARYMAGPSQPAEDAAAREIWARLDSGSRDDRALMMVGLGFTIAEVARHSGLSRQKIYRLRAAFVERCGHEGPG